MGDQEVQWFYVNHKGTSMMKVSTLGIHPLAGTPAQDCIPGLLLCEKQTPVCKQTVGFLSYFQLSSY